MTSFLLEWGRSTGPRSPCEQRHGVCHVGLGGGGGGTSSAPGKQPQVSRCGRMAGPEGLASETQALVGRDGEMNGKKFAHG